MFTKKEKENISIEHILPQTLSPYWQKLYQAFSDEERAMLTGALGNLLPLSQSINASLQNVSFPEKKTSRAGRRGYENGCHSEIEVSRCDDWTAVHIYERSRRLFHFMEERWDLRFQSEQLDRLVHVNFAVEGRTPPEGTIEQEEALDPRTTMAEAASHTLDEQQGSFWEHFVRYCHRRGRDAIVRRKPRSRNWYDVPIGSDAFQLQFTLTHGNCVSLAIYAYDMDAFQMLENKKEPIESVFREPLDWYSSRESSSAKRIVCRHEAAVFDTGEQEAIFDWMIRTFDSLMDALAFAGVWER